jgi:sulfate adenylyltransferase subunit 2
MISSVAGVLNSITSTRVGDTATLVSNLALEGHALSRRQVTRLVGELFEVAPLRSFQDLRDFEGQPSKTLVAEAFDRHASRKRLRLWFGQFASIGDRRFVLLSDRRGSAAWSQLEGSGPEHLRDALIGLTRFLGERLVIVPHGELHLAMGSVEPIVGLTLADFAHGALPFRESERAPAPSAETHSHLRSLEAESIRIFREAVAVAQNPAMLFSMGKDSMVMWELAKKAFWPEPPPFPLIVIDTRWKFQDMYRFREYITSLPETDLRVHINPDAIARDVNPFDFGSATHTEITKTIALKQILDAHQFDFVFGGARRDEERSRAKERVFSVRNERHGWDPKSQRPELWDIYNTVLPTGHSMRVFPLSNWTELDVWRYVEAEAIPVVPLYFSKTRPFVERDGALIMVDDERFRLNEVEEIRFEPIRFRTLGCYPLTGGVRSHASTVGEIIGELEESRVSERSSRVIDFDPGASMEQKKKDGYF